MFYKNKQREKWLIGLRFRKTNAADFPLCADILVSSYKGEPWSLGQKKKSVKN